jgi:hypothetical protein
LIEEELDPVATAHDIPNHRRTQRSGRKNHARTEESRVDVDVGADPDTKKEAARLDRGAAS